jgi:hypothetical protein
MINRRLWNLPSYAAIWLLTLFSAQSASSYSVLTHEAIIDSTWDSAIKPLLLKRFPASPPQSAKGLPGGYGGKCAK